jgi:alanyl-tRNA synthetase
MLRSVSDTVQKQNKSCIVVLASCLPGRLIFLVTVTQDLVKQGYSARKIADVFTGVVGGKGGGRENKVEGGGKDPTRIDEAFARVRDFIGRAG